MVRYLYSLYNVCKNVSNYLFKTVYNLFSPHLELTKPDLHIVLVAFKTDINMYRLHH